MSETWEVGHDGPSRPIITTSTHRMLSISQFENGRWASYEKEEEDCARIVADHNAREADPLENQGWWPIPSTSGLRHSHSTHEHENGERWHQHDREADQQTIDPERLRLMIAICDGIQTEPETEGAFADFVPNLRDAARFRPLHTGHFFSMVADVLAYEKRATEAEQTIAELRAELAFAQEKVTHWFDATLEARRERSEQRTTIAELRKAASRLVMAGRSLREAVPNGWAERRLWDEALEKYKALTAIAATEEPHD